MPRPPRVAEIWRYPVKSMVGERVPSAEVAGHGLVGDRHWALHDDVRGGIRGAKKLAGLMRFAAERQLDGSVTITLPDGSTVSTLDADRDQRVSAALGHPVSLRELPGSGDLDHFRRGAPDSDDVEGELRGIFGRDEDEPLPDLSIFPPEIIEYESPPGTHHDAFPLLILSTSALRTLAESLPGSAIDVRRFRPSLVLDTGDEPGHPELSWVGRRMAIGDVVLDLPAACPRCVMVTRPIDDAVPEDRAVLRHIVRELDQNLGVYATVASSGTIAVGDEVDFHG